jgi:hypothetical protein
MRQNIWNLFRYGDLEERKLQTHFFSKMYLILTEHKAENILICDTELFSLKNVYCYLHDTTINKH